jgi:endonuclease/exonuclease/phosphatase family metal-dependent hydrolase
MKVGFPRCVIAGYGYFLVGVVGWLAAGTSGAHEPVRVMSFNIRHDNPQDGENAWPHRRDWVAELIRDNRVDVLGMQEVLKSQIDDLRQRLTDYGWYGVGRDDGQEAGEYAPIFYRADRFELLDKGVFWLCEKPDEPGRIDWNAACTRIVTWIALREKHDGGKRYFFNTHFDHESAEARVKSAELIRQRIAEIKDGPIVLTGDFNCLANSEPIKSIAAKEDGAEQSMLTDAYELAKPFHQGPTSTWNGFRQVVPNRRIDFVFVSPGWKVKAHRILDDQREGRFASDHLPVLAELSR